MLHTLRFSLQNAVYFIMVPFLVPVLFTFYIQRKSTLERIKNENIKEIMGVKEKPDIIDIIQKKRLQWYGHVKRMQEEKLPKLIVEWIPGERRKRGRPNKTWMEGVRAAMETRHLEADQWLKRKEWYLGSGRRRQLS
jgi:hypothetical protein